MAAIAHLMGWVAASKLNNNRSPTASSTLSLIQQTRRNDPQLSPPTISHSYHHQVSCQVWYSQSLLDHWTACLDGSQSSG